VRGVLPVLDAPAGREDGLGKGPAPDSLEVESEELAEQGSAPGADSCGIGIVVQRGRVAEEGAALVLRFPDDALGVDAGPAFAGAKDVVVVEVTVEEDTAGLRRAELQVGGFASGDARRGQGAVRRVVVAVAGETRRPSDPPKGRARWGRRRGGGRA
jgi:hypothetical protein